MSARTTAALVALAGLAAALLEPAAAQACAVCAGQDSAAVSWAMLKGTALLSLTPLAILGAGAWYLRRRARQLAAADLERSEPQSPGRCAARSS
jgi:hypothetical protein